MKAEMKAKWIVALRSGKYQQARKSLRINNEFCCLGVLLDSCIDGSWEGENYEVDDITFSGDLGNYGQSMFGLTDIQQQELVHMNDNLRVSLPEIADWIQTNIAETP